MATKVYQKKNGQLELVLTDTSEEVSALQEGMTEVKETSDASVTSISVSGQTLVLTHGDGTQSSVETGFVTSADSEVSAAEIYITTPISAGSDVTVPRYIVGTNTLAIYIDGLRADRGSFFSEKGNAGEGSTYATINVDVDENYEVMACSEVVISGSHTDSGTPAKTEAYIEVPAASSTDIAVPAYIVGSRTVNLFVDGILCRRGEDFTEVGTHGEESTTIHLTSSYDESFTILVVVG